MFNYFFRTIVKSLFIVSVFLLSVIIFFFIIFYGKYDNMVLFYHIMIQPLIILELVFFYLIISRCFGNKTKKILVFIITITTIIFIFIIESLFESFFYVRWNQFLFFTSDLIPKKIKNSTYTGQLTFVSDYIYYFFLSIIFINFSFLENIYNTLEIIIIIMPGIIIDVMEYYKTIDFKQSLTTIIQLFLVWINKWIYIIHETILYVYFVTVIIFSIFKLINYKYLKFLLDFIIGLLLFFIIIIDFLYFYIQKNDISFIHVFEIKNNLLTSSIFSFRYDTLSLFFTTTVYLISFIVHQYQNFYMEDLLSKNKFLLLLNFFIISMITIVLTTNWFTLLLAWETLGLSSFFLIGFYKNKIPSFKSAIKAFFYNKLSDICVLLAVITYFTTYGNFNMNLETCLTSKTTIIGLFFLLASLVKSAQVIFFFWLPDSMEAPLPASALIHSATLVSAGIYLCLRFINLIEVSNTAHNILFISSLSSMLIAPLLASSQTDIKKILAFSTIANCGYIYLLIYTKTYTFAIYYFVIHGILKSFSFLISGTIITNNNHMQDIRKWNNFTFETKLNLILLLVLILTISGLPISTFYIIKTNTTNFDSISTIQWFTINITLMFYSTTSYLYSIKLILFFYRKKIFFLKKKQHKFFIKLQPMIVLFFINLFIFLYVSIFYTYLIKTTETAIHNFNWLVLLITLTIILIYIPEDGIKSIFIFLFLMFAIF